jgi:flagellar biosynthesis/type III secretory pathway protein FliH
MAETLTINLAKPISSAQIIAADLIGNYDVPLSTASLGTPDEREMKNDKQYIEKQKGEIAQLYQTLNCLVGELNRYYDEVLSKQSEEIAKLSVEIANKVLMQKVQKGDYKIESIIKEALKNAPTCQEVVVHLNPEDLALYQKKQKDDTNNTLEGIKCIADPAIGRAECLLETPKGIVKSFIEKHIEQISEALSKVE